MRSFAVFCLILGAVVELSPMLLPAVQAQSTSAAWLNPHNSARRAVNAGEPNLVWNSALAQYATNWARRQATQDSCRLKHSGGQYGENIYWYSATATPAMAVQAWVNEKQYYKYATNSCASGKVCGHYTQVVWKKSLRLGCGQATCAGGGTFMVCSYDPPGNYVGQKPY